jgi:hypothetical protein
MLMPQIYSLETAASDNSVGTIVYRILINLLFGHHLSSVAFKALNTFSPDVLESEGLLFASL